MLIRVDKNLIHNNLSIAAIGVVDFRLEEGDREENRGSAKDGGDRR
jgi:hypothetical protein